MRSRRFTAHSDGTTPLRFDLDAAALNGSDAVLAIVDRLVDRAADKVHRITAPAADLLETTWFKSSRSQRAAVLRASMSAPVARRTGDANEPELHRTSVSIHDLPSAQRANLLAHTPLTIWVEDEEADGVFVEIVVEEFGGELAELWAACRAATPVGVEFRSAGINTLPDRLRRQSTNAGARPLRLLVIHDSDRRWPGDAKSEENIARVASACAEIGVPNPHCLRKRTLENYIPDAALAAYAAAGSQTHGKQTRLAALLRLSAIQRDHLPWKGKLSDAEFEAGVTAGHYTPEATPHLATLRTHGLFDKRPRPMQQLAEHRDSFDVDGLKARDGHGELEQILDRIAEML